MASVRTVQPLNEKHVPSQHSLDETEVPAKFVCKTSNTRPLSVLLNSLPHSRDQVAEFEASAHGILITVREPHAFQAMATLGASLFQEYAAPEPVTIKIHIALLIDCLNVFGVNSQHSTALIMMYGGHGERLMLWLQESQTVQAVGSIATLQGPLVDEHSSTVFQEFDFKKTHVVNEVMVKPDALHAAFSELDWGASYARLLLSPDPPYFRLSCDSPAGSIEIELPSDAEIFGGMFSCKQTQTNKYKMALLQPAVKALQPATSARFSPTWLAV